MSTSNGYSSLRYGIGSQGRVLVVDDNVRNLQAVVNCLNMESFEVHGVSSGEEALTQLTHRPPELILLDVVMPILNGFELCKMIKENAEWAEIPILFLSGDRNVESINKAFEIGGVDYIGKPFQRAELVARVRTHVELTRRRKQTQQYWEQQANLLQNSVQQWQAPLHRIKLMTGELQNGDVKNVEGLAEKIFKEADSLIQDQQAFFEQFEKSFELASQEAQSPSFGVDDLKVILGQWYVTAKRKNIDLKVRAPSKNLRMRGGAYAISTIFESVLSNSVNFTPQDGSILVTIRKVNNRIQITVSDSGPGFPQDYLDHQFAPYLRESSNKMRSLGVGLASAKKAATRINAELEIDTSYSPGAQVIISFEEDTARKKKDPIF